MTWQKVFLYALCGGILFEAEAMACGCFAVTPQTPVVQAGEKILFAKEGDNIVASIQIQYSGSAGEFGWLLPLPSVPTLELGTDEIFDTLTSKTQPSYILTTNNACTGTSSSSGGGIGCG